MFLKKVFFKFFIFDLNSFFYDLFFKRFFIFVNNKYYFINFFFNSFLFLKFKFLKFYNYFQFLILHISIVYFVRLNLVGLGFKIFKYKQNLIFKLGYSHYLKIFVPGDIKIFLKRFSFIILSSINLNILWNFIAKFYKFKNFNFYKGKGFSLLNKSEIVLKIGKQQQS